MDLLRRCRVALLALLWLAVLSCCVGSRDVQSSTRRYSGTTAFVSFRKQDGILTQKSCVGAHMIFSRRSSQGHHKRKQQVEKRGEAGTRLTMMVEQESGGTQFTPQMETAWRYIKKPLLRIGSRGVSPSHGNSLRELLNQHRAVKVKVNTNRMGTLEDVFGILSGLVVDAGGPEGIELLRVRPSESTILFGLPGMTEEIESGAFPPKYIPKAERDEGKTDEGVP